MFRILRDYLESLDSLERTMGIPVESADRGRVHFFRLRVYW